MAILVVVVFMSLFLGAGRDIWSLGAVVVLAGLGVLMAPPAFRLPAWIAGCLVVLGAAPMLQLMPATWFGGMPAWRLELWEAWRIGTPFSQSPLPGAALESWMVMAGGVVWLWTCLGQRADNGALRTGIYGLALGGCLLAVATAVDYFAWSIPWWPRSENMWQFELGPFINRNHTSSICAIAVVLSAGAAYDAYRRRSAWAWVFGILIWPPAVMIFLNTSRGGLVLLLLGMMAWLTTSAMKKGLVRKVAVGAAVLLLIASVAAVSGGKLGTRLRSLVQDEKVSPLTSSLRLDLAYETLVVAREKPVLGQGLDAFAPLFPLVSDFKAHNFRFRHPESDVMLLLFEGGLLLLVPCLLIVGWVAAVILRAGSLKSDSPERGPARAARRLRRTAAVGAGMALFHGIFDVPNHVPGYGLQTALLMGLAIEPLALRGSMARLGKGLFRMAGIALVAGGVFWLGCAFQTWQPDIPSSVAGIRGGVTAEAERGNYREALALANRAVRISPLDFRNYFQRAQLMLLLGSGPEPALLDFGRSRALEPNYAAICFEEGDYWLRYYPEIAIVPWREGLRRVPASFPDTKKQWYSNIVSKGYSYPELRAALWGLAENPDMQLIFLLHCPREDGWEEWLARFLEANPNLETLEATSLRQLFRAWHERGDRNALVDLLEKNSSLQMFGWRTLAHELAAKGEYEEAFFTAGKFVKKEPRQFKVDASNISRLERAFVFNPADAHSGTDLYFAYRTVGDLKEARRTAEKVVLLPDAPGYMRLELAYLCAEMKDFRRAWEAMEQAVIHRPDA